MASNGQTQNILVMIYSYLKIALRNIKKQKLFSAINIFGLSFSLSVCLIIIMLVADQSSYDDFNADADRVYRVNHTKTDMDAVIAGMATSPMPLGEELMSNYTGIENYARLYRGFGNKWIKIEHDVNIPIAGYYADAGVFDVFQYELALGNKHTALEEPYSVVLSHEGAKKLFNTDNPIGEVIKVGELGSYKVTGVLKPIDGKSHIKFEGLASISTVPGLVKQGVLSTPLDDWKNRNRGWTYLKLQEGTTVEQVEQDLAQISHAQYDQYEDINADFYLQNIRKISPGPLMGNPIGPSVPFILVYFLTGLAVIVMISACFNYTNLSIARSLERAREVGVRKVFGAVRGQVFTQFLTESVVIAVLAFFFSLVLMTILKPAFLALNFSQMLDWDLKQSFSVYLLSLVFSILVGIIAGVLPSSFHSSVKALDALKKLSGVKVMSRVGMRKALIVGQFCISLLLVITVKVIYDQMDFMLNKDYGFDKEANIVIRLNNTDPELLKTELQKYASVTNVSAACFVPASGTSTQRDVFIEEEEKALNFFYADEDYLDNMGLELIAGKTFTKDNRKNKLIINEQAIPFLGFENAIDAIGKPVITDDSVTQQVVGVIKDFHHETLLSEIKPLAIQYNPERFSILQAKVNSQNVQAAFGDIEKAWVTVNPSLQIDYKLMADEVSFFTEMMFGDLSKVVFFISMLAISISCMGLMGIVVYSTQLRMKEVSIRKVLGATSKSLVLLLSKSFIKLLGVSIVLAVPLAWLINNAWLNSIAYRTEISVFSVLLAVFIVATLGFLVIGSQTFKTANSNPGKTLREE